MKKVSGIKIFSILAVMLTLVLSVGVFSTPSKTYADTNKYTITFKCSGENNSSAETIKTITIDAGDNILLSDLPKEGDPGLPKIENNKYIWFYVVGGKLIKATIPEQQSGIVIKDVSSDIVFWAIKQDTSKKHTITFIMPDSTIVTKTVSDGGTVDEPMFELGFCERVKYDKSLENVKEDMTINVSIDNTLKYIFMAGCCALLVTSLTVIVLVVFKTLKEPEDDWEDELVPAGESSKDDSVDVEK